MSDLHEIKKLILSEDKVGYLLEQMGCDYVSPKRERVEAQLPDKFDSPNKRSVQVYLNDHLSSRIRTMGVSNIDIYGLVSYIVFDIYDEDDQLKNIPKSKKWICDTLGYSGFDFTPVKNEATESLKWLKEIRKSRKKSQIIEIDENRIYEDKVLENFDMFPHQIYIDEGISIETQLEFQIGYDLRSSRIIYPIHNQFGEIVSIKGRTIDPNWYEKDIYKFIYLMNFNKSLELYNWHRSLYYILEKKEVIIFEGEKGCWLSTQWGFRNCVAMGGDDLSPQQVEMVKSLGADIRIVLAMDKDKDVAAIKRQGAKFGKVRDVYAMWDKTGLLLEKDSPFDRGREVFEELYGNYKKYKIS